MCGGEGALFPRQQGVYRPHPPPAMGGGDGPPVNSAITCKLILHLAQFSNGYIQTR